MPAQVKPDEQNFFKKLMDSAMGTAQVVDSAKSEPTLASMKPDTFIKHGSNIFFKFSDGTGLKVAGTSFT